MDKGSKISEPQTTEASELTCKLRKDMAKSKITAAESFISRATEAVINIFSEVSPQVECKEHMNHIMQHIIQNRNEAALDIAEFIWANKQAFGLNQPDGSSTSDHQSGYDPYFEDTDILRFLRDTDLSEIYIWNVLLNKIKTFFLRKIIKEVIVSYIVKLRNGPYGFSAEKTPLNAIVPVASEIVEALIPPSNQKKCVFKETQSRIFNSDYKMVSELLEEFLLDMIGPDDDPVKFREINWVAKSVMNNVWFLLVFEVEERNQRNKAVMSLEKIKPLVIDFPKPTEEEPEEPAPPTTVEPDGSDDEEEDISGTPVKESKPLPITSKSDVSNDDEDELIDEDDDSLTPESKPLPITSESDVSDDEEEDISGTPVKESKPLPITSESDVSDDDGDELSDVDEDELIDEDDDSLTPEVPLPNVTAKQPQSTEHIDPFYMIVVSAVLGQIFKKARSGITVSQQIIEDISSPLALMLCTKLAGSDFVKPRSDKIEKTARALYKALCKEMGSRDILLMRLLSKHSVYEDVTETIKRHLVKPRQTGVKGFFNSFFKIVSYPFRACFTHG
ncbi:hypothetical protein D5F01_LYC13833 [Larimichthys crocea]|uniref:Uncharacterized protein n=1 Tax=Larimichthys crocea TaxID=215358 RepID=A0A6G0I9B2_LARCR|nr:hypothetical protein D5F01_LYC13833 [Larimichthys crocea]